MYSVTIHGTTASVAISSGQCVKTSVEAATGYGYLTFTIFDAEPGRVFEGEPYDGMGGYKANFFAARKSFNLTTEFMNQSGLNTWITSLETILKKNYIYLELSSYEDTLHDTGKVIPVVITDYTIDPAGIKRTVSISMESKVRV